jgi:hypothetical protein
MGHHDRGLPNRRAATALNPSLYAGEDRHHLPIAVIGCLELAAHFSMADGKNQPWNGTPLRNPPGLRAGTGT